MPYIARYGKGQATDDVAVAVRMLLEQNVVANIPAGASLVSLAATLQHR